MLFTLPLAQRREMVESGELVPATYRRQLVEYVRETDPRLRAFADWRPADLAGSPVPDLPSVTYKDTIDVAGYPTRLGIRSGYRRYPARSAAIVEQLTRRGLACVGKVSTTECALGTVKPSRNPVYPHVSPAGSSTGSAVAVAAGFCDASVGTDSGGSLRWPAVYCGVTALRFTPRPELLEGVAPVAPSLESVGLVTRTPEDLEWLWRNHHLDQVAGGPLWTSTDPWRIAVSRPPEPLHPEVAALLDRIRDRLAAAGHRVTEPALPDVWATREPAAELLAREAYDSFGDFFEEVGPDTQAALVRGSTVDDARYTALRQDQGRAQTRLAARLTDDHDLLVVPLEPGLPDPAEPTGPVADAGPHLTLVANFARLPVLALPLGLSTVDSPLGVQVLARPGADDLLVRAARALSDINR